jgi:hypothetical protein
MNYTTLFLLLIILIIVIGLAMWYSDNKVVAHAVPDHSATESLLDEHHDTVVPMNGESTKLNVDA